MLTGAGSDHAQPHGPQVTPSAVSGMRLHTPPGGVRKLNKRGAGIAFGLVLLVVSVAVAALVTKQQHQRDANVNKTYKPNSSQHFADSFLSGRPDGNIGAKPEPPDKPAPEPAKSASAGTQSDPAPGDRSDETEKTGKADRSDKPNETGRTEATATNPATDSTNPELQAQIVLHQQALRKLAETDELRRVKQQQEKMHAAVQSAISVNFNRAGDPTIAASHGEESGAGNRPLAGGYGGDTMQKLNAMRMAALGARTNEAGGVNISGALAGLGLGRGRVDYSDINRHAQKNAFVQRQQSEHMQATYLPHTRTKPLSNYEIKAGTVLPATLISGVNSDLPGQLLAQINHNVLDTATGEYVLIPQGAKLIGRYDNDVSYGQTRALVVWNRVIYPDGSSLSLQGMQGHDRQGYSGFMDRVNNHYFKVFGSAILMSFISGAITVSRDPGEDRDTRSNREVLNESLGREVGRVATELVRRNLRIAPTLEIRPGYRFAVVVNRDMVLAPYEPMQTLLRNRGRIPPVER